MLEKSESRITKEQIRSVLTSLNLSVFVTALFDEREDLKNYGFYDYFAPPYHIINSNRKEQDLFRVDRYVPLFETGYDFSEVLAYDKLLEGFVRYSPEYMVSIQTSEVLTWDGTFVDQILTWYEDDKSESEIMHICGLLGLEHTKEILHSIYDVLGADYTTFQIDEWKVTILSKIQGRIK